MQLDEDKLARQLWALGDVVRLRLLHRLPRSPDCEHRNNVSQLAEDMGLAQPTISHHLRVLRQAGLVQNKKMCRDVIYWLNEDAAAAVIEHLRLAMQHTERAPLDVAARKP